MGLTDETQSVKIVRQLKKKCEKNQYKIGTGFLTTYQILQVLTDYGYGETAYKMLTQSACPGWMYEIDQKASTVWENWLGIDENGVPKDSQNHYAMGAAAAWLFSRVGGITPMKLGFSEVKIQPFAVGELTWAETSYTSMYGEIAVKWERKGKQFCIQISLPENVSALVVMPDGKQYTVLKGTEIQCELQEGEQ